MKGLRTARTWGGIGAIFSLFYITYFVGFIMKLFAVKEIAEATEREKIFRDYVWAAVLNILASFILSWALYRMWVKIPYMITNPEEFMDFMSAFGMWTFLAAIIMIVGVFFMKKSYDGITEETGVGLFRTAATMYLIGAVLSLIMVGYFFILLGAILEVMAFFGLPEEVPGRGATETGSESTVEEPTDVSEPLEET